MFGYRPLIPEKFQIENQEIEIEEKDGMLRYTRGNTSKLIKKSSYSLKIVPRPAFGYGVHYLTINFKEPVIVPPKDTFRGYVESPCDIELKLGDMELDLIKLGKEKYTIYGTVDIGDISRYHLSEVYTKEPDSPCVTKFILSNGSNYWKTFEKLVFPIWETIMYYSEDKAYYPTIINITKNGTVELLNTAKTPKNGLTGTKNVTPVSNFLRRI
ncbi:DUF432 domain-containing protein [Methanococcus maripaludis]|uniref:Conserved hypothetical archaeal protein n=1 Tax=Methanococcus maripaludis (strain DSM 14266 / JCM 13030 / NBRC 101832 / S2 / LL) TaxID=267377 RepID=Q6LZT8_METMP|nr:DUF432 domain-containing protein [Methanococcus maripaludis]CAF30091.1 conserved hypothetical archaeal protein [Methanococcus maripaludis S2]